MSNFNFRDGPFLKLEEADSLNWIKYAYFPKEDKVEDKEIEMRRRKISPEAQEHFEKAQHEFFKSKKRESDVRDALSRTVLNYSGEERNVPYLWANNELIIRQASTSDQRNMLNILDEAKKQSGSYAPDSYFKSVISKGLLIVVTDYRNIVRGLQTLHVRKDTKTGKVTLGCEACLYIEEEFRRKGAFRKIFDVVFDAAADSHCDVVFTRCAEENLVAEKYEHVGFNRLDKKIISTVTIDGKDTEVVGIGFEKEIILKGHATFF